MPHIFDGMKKFIRVVLLVVFIPIVWVAGNLLYGTLTDYQPEERIEVEIEGQGIAKLDSSFNIVIWNIGYAGLGEESDFFYDGGSTVRMEKDIVRKNFQGIYNFVKANDSIDIFLLQEVDTDSKRSYNTNEFGILAENMTGYSAAMCLNYKVDLVPVPYLEPMGRVRAGLANFSKYQPSEAIRYQYPSSYSWPNRIYFLDRCCLLNRYPLENGHDLVVINTHNSAYDDGGMKKVEMDYLKQLVTAEYEAGNYVVVGGDWNQCPPLADVGKFIPDGAETDLPSTIPEDFLPGWTWAYDPAFPTNRSLKAPYDRLKTPKQLIDYYLLSPNLEIQDVRTLAMHFQYSDHEPVYLKVKMRDF